MGTAERRHEMLLLLCRKRHETVSELASLFGVSRRTVMRDIEALSFSVPLYTKKGRFGGGVYLVEGYSMDRMYMKPDELALLRRLLFAAQNPKETLSEKEVRQLSELIAGYTPPDGPDFCGKNCKTG